MNKASETAIKWVFDENGIQEAEYAPLIEAIYEGCHKGEAHAFQVRDHILDAALRTASAKDETADQFIKACVNLHFEFEQHAKDVRNLETLGALRKIADNPPATPLGLRIGNQKALELIQKLR
jgi:hypothetical protein